MCCEDSVDERLFDGFATALTPINHRICRDRDHAGTAVGVLPGIGPAMTLALLLPLTYELEPTSAFIMFAGIYYGGMYGVDDDRSAEHAEGSSVVTAIEGNKMAKAERPLKRWRPRRWARSSPV